MKKIPLNVYHFAGGLRIMASFFLKNEDPKIFTLIEAVVDTGSPTTIISLRDVIKSRISPIQLKKLANNKNPIKFGGGMVSTRIAEDAYILLGEHINKKMPIHIVDNGDKETPSILGVDFMINNKCSLFFDPNKREAYFNMEE